jgi:hypothetical protein
VDLKEFENELSKYPKDVIIKTIYNEFFFRHEDVVRRIQWDDIQCRFDKLMAQSEDIRKQMEPLIGKKDNKSFIEYLTLMEKDNKIQKKINAVMKEMDRHNERDD